MADDDDKDQDQSQTGNITGTGSGRTFTQEELNAYCTKEHARGNREGRREAEAALLEKAGGVPFDELLAAHKQVKAAADALKSAEQVSAEAAEKARREAEADRALAAQTLLESRVTRALDGAKIAESARGVAAKALDGLTPAATDEEIVAAVEALKTQIPQLFTPASQVADADPQTKGGKQSAGEFGAEGKRRYEARFGKPGVAK